jgi:hypothetical protein
MILQIPVEMPMPEKETIAIARNSKLRKIPCGDAVYARLGFTAALNEIQTAPLP